MNEVSTLRMYVLRAMYAFVVVGLGAVLWPDLLNPARHWTLAEGEISCMLAAFSLMCVLGIRYPLQDASGPALGDCLEDNVAGAGASAAMEGRACGRSAEANGLRDFAGGSGVPGGALGVCLPALCKGNRQQVECKAVAA